MSSTAPDHPRHWSLEIFEMSSLPRQQRALRVFARVQCPEVQVLGVALDDRHYLVVDSDSAADEVRSRRIVLTVDPLAARVHVAGPRRHRHGSMVGLAGS